MTFSGFIVENLDKKVNHQKLVDFEGFRSNGYHHVNQRIFLHRLQWGKIDFDDFFGKILNKSRCSIVKP